MFLGFSHVPPQVLQQYAKAIYFVLNKEWNICVILTTLKFYLLKHHNFLAL